MHKFVDIKLDDEIYSIVFGLGKVIFVLAKQLRLDGYFVFEVQYNNGQKVYYTEDGRPGWCKDLTKCSKTIFYKSEVDFNNIDSRIGENDLNKNQILHFQQEGVLEMLSPAGGWIDANLMPDIMVENAINNGEYHLFREMTLCHLEKIAN